ncbi:MAG: hypothetical protein ACK4TI_03065 [Nitrososphaerales archaeon]
MRRCYVRQAYIHEKKVAIYAVPEDLEVSDEVVEKVCGYAFVIKPADTPPKFKANDVKIIKLPDENSLLTFFPFEYLLGDKVKIVRVMDELLRKYRGGGSYVTCFYKGCRRRAVFYAESPLGLTKGGCWYACSKEHFSNLTSKGYPIKEEDFRRLISLG